MLRLNISVVILKDRCTMLRMKENGGPTVCSKSPILCSGLLQVLQGLRDDAGMKLKVENSLRHVIALVGQLGGASS